MNSIINKIRKIFLTPRNATLGTPTKDANITTYLKKINFSDNLNANLILFFLLGIIVFVFVYGLRNIALAVHDDVGNYINLRVSPFSELIRERIDIAMWRGRFGIPDFFIFSYRYLILNLGSRFVYTLGFYAPIIINACFFSYIIAKRTNRYLWFFLVSMYFSFAQINFQHNLFVTYPLYFHLYFFILLLSAEFFLQHFEKTTRYSLPLSAFFMFIAFTGYEAFPMYFSLFVVFLLCRAFFSDESVKAFFKSLLLLKYHVVACILFLVNYFVQSRLSGIEMQYDGITIDVGSITIRSVLTVLYSFAVDLFPLRDFVRHGFIQSFRISEVGIEYIIMALCFTLVICLVLMKNIQLSGKKVVTICCVSLVAVFVLPFPNSLTVHSHNFINWGYTGFTVSFFGYYWFILMISVLTVYLYGLLKFNKLLLLLIAPILFTASLFTSYSNAHFIKLHEANTIRYEAFSRLFSSSYAENIESGALIYVRGYTGVYHNLDYLTRYARRLTSNTFTFTRTLSDLQYNDNTWVLIYDKSNRFIMIGKTNDGLTADEIFFMPTENITNGGLIGTKSHNASFVTINDELKGMFNQSIIIPIDYINLDGITVKADSLKFEQMIISDSTVFSNDLARFEFLNPNTRVTVETGLSCMLSSGWNHPEPWGIWSTGHSNELAFSLLAEEITKLELVFYLSTILEPVIFDVYVNDFHIDRYSMYPDRQTITFIVSHELLSEVDGFYNINVRFEIVNPKHDIREIGIGLVWFEARSVTQ